MTRVQQIVDECLCKRTSGELLTDEAVCAAHADLLPELAEALRTLQVIERSRSSRGRRSARHQLNPVNGTMIEAPAIPTNAFPGYELIRELHRGGQGVIYRAVQRSTGRKVALKILLDGAFAGPLDRARFEREVKVLASLQHQNIVTIHDSGSAAGRFFFAMDYIAGQPLDVYMSSEPRTIDESLHLFLKICDAVDAAHVRGIIHRDLKPANIRVDDRGEPYILDFGLARMTGGPMTDGGAFHTTMTQTGQFIGSLPWAAPEQADGSPTRIDTRSDVYSLGVVFYQMLTGKFPYSVVGPIHEVVRRITDDAPLSPRRLRPEIDDDLSTIVLRCLAKNRERRYQTAGELGRDVDRLIRGEPIEAKRDSAWYMLRKTLARFKLLLSVAALFLVVLAVSTMVSWSAWRAAAQREAEAQASLWDSLLAQARAIRKTEHVGCKSEALDAIARAASIKRNVLLRNELIATLQLTDAEIRPLPGDRRGMAVFDSDIERCVVVNDLSNTYDVVRVNDGALLTELRGLPVGAQLQLSKLSGRFFARVFDLPEDRRALEVWNVPTGRLVLRIDDIPPKGAFDIAPDKTTLAFAGSDQAVHLYDLAADREMKVIPLDRVPSRMSFDPTGQRLALYHAAFDRASIVDCRNGKCAPVFDVPIGWSVVWSADGRVLAGVSANDVYLWDAVRSRKIGVLRGHEAVVTHLALSPDGRRLASRSWDDFSIVWDIATRQPLVEMEGSLVAFSPNGKSIGGWNLEMADGRRFPRPVVFDLKNSSVYERLAGPGAPDVLATNISAFSPDGKRLLNCVLSDGRPNICGLCLFDPRDGRQLTDPIPGRFWIPGFKLKGDAIFAFEEGRGFMLWPVSVEGASLEIGAPQTVISGSEWLGAAQSNDGNVVAFSERPGQVCVFRADDPGDINRFECSELGLVQSLNRNGRWVVVTRWHLRDAEVWDTLTAKRIATIPTQSWTFAEFSSDDRYMVVGDSNSLSLWNTTTWTKENSVAGLHSWPRYSPDGTFIAAITGNGVRLYDSPGLNELCTLSLPERFSNGSLEISADGARLVQMSNRAGVGGIWDLRRLRAQLAPYGLDWNASGLNLTP